MRELERLRDENKRLSTLVEIDWLTDIYNRGAVATKINSYLKTNQTGVLFVMDINRFKKINDVYGHLCGDNVLRNVGKILKQIAQNEGIAGRIGGDEFILFIMDIKASFMINEMEHNIETKLSQITYGKKHIPLSIAVRGAISEEQDTYETLFQKADQRLLQQKEQLKQYPSTIRDSIHKDSFLIQQELKETDMCQGAYCQHYDAFKSIYRFLERCLNRSERHIYLILLTLSEDDEQLPYENQEAYMKQLNDAIQHSLRIGDVFTRYSSCQFLIMAVDTDEKDIVSIVNRIKKTFFDKEQDSVKKMILYHSFPLEAVAHDGHIQGNKESLGENYES